jgi:hypothetical protein
MSVPNARAGAQRCGTDANFAAMDAASITKPVVMGVAAPKRGKFSKNSRCSPARGPSTAPLAKKIGHRVCKVAQFMLRSHLMSAQPRSDRRVGQGGDFKKGNTHRTPDSTSIVVLALSRASRGSIATRRRSPHFSLFSLLPVPGLAGARASTLPVALTRVWRRRHSGRPGESY